ncbi:tetratricopeptide repeat protein [Streptomyces sp. JJ38]|uniref:tetratricopeptide repeat protein n=1 Tax=Streptomyces sp. JJ38 TaxID=2738128 RepID=UPI001C590F9A|nr:tetratricopeptide repeat protein [Streptomyces sp. JJ38]MBW1595650.1 tetratricopeptide repeat protein [Streptomyces sp. JJ38]
MTDPGRDAPRPASQEIRVESGFGYGVINADLHVYGNGLPLYLLANWRTEPDADPRWLRELPSRLLNARRAVVPFTGRVAELSELREWRESDSHRAVRWLHGPGGQGKSRLAAQFAAESAAAGWKVVTAFHGPEADRPEPGSEDMSLDGAAGLLLIVDYADRWRLTHLTWLFKNRLLHRGRTRVLMLARSADTWPGVRGVLENAYEASTASTALAPLDAGASGRSDGRAEMFEAARDSFAAVYEMPDASSIAPPAPLHDEAFGLILAVHVAALVAVDAAVHGVRPPVGPDALTMYLLDREQLHWARLYADGDAEDDHGYRTPPAEMNRAVFTAVLVGQQAGEKGQELLATAGLADPERTVRDHAVCYPSPVPGITLEPLYPDRLAEDFLALTQPGHDADYPAQSWASETTTRLLTRAPTSDENGEAVASRGLAFLTNTAERWPHVRRETLFPLLRDDPRRALVGGNGVLTLLAGMEDIETELLRDIASRFPLTQDPDHDLGIAAVTVQLTRRLLPATSDPIEQISLYNTLAIRLMTAGRFAEATEAAEAMRRLSAAFGDGEPNPPPDLVALLEENAQPLPHRREGGIKQYLVDGAVPGSAKIFSALASNDRHLYARTSLAEAARAAAHISHSLGRHPEALRFAEHGVSLLREVEAPISRSRLPYALETLALVLREFGRHQEALDSVEEAIRILRADAGSAASDEFRFTLANFSQGRGLHLGALGRYEEAVEANRESVELCHGMSTAENFPVSNTLAYAYNNMSADQTALGLHEESLQNIEKAVEIRRRYAAANEALHGREYAMSLYNLGISLARVGRFQEGLEATEESVGILSRLAEEAPEVHHATLAQALVNLHFRKAEAGSPTGDLDALGRASGIYWELEQRYPLAYRRDLADVLFTEGTAELVRRSSVVRARRLLQRAVKLYMELAADDPPKHLTNFSKALVHLAHACSGPAARQRPTRNAETLGQATRLLVELLPQVPEADRADLYGRLGDLTGALLSGHWYEEALSVAGEAARMVRERPGDPGEICNAHVRYAITQNGAGRPDAEVLSTLDVALRHARAGLTEGSAPALLRMAGTLSFRSILLTRLRRYAEAVAAADEAIALYRPVAETDFDACGAQFAFALVHAAAVLHVAGEREAALARIEEACGAYERLARMNESEFRPFLHHAVSVKDEILGSAPPPRPDA